MRCDDLALYRELNAALKDGKSAVLATVIEADAAGAVGAKALYVPRSDRFLATPAFPADWLDWVKAGCKARFEEERERPARIGVQRPPSSPCVRVAFELFSPAPRLVIAGGGHIAQAVHNVAVPVGFSVVVIDDRPLYANRERFPFASEVICDAFSSGLVKAGLDETTSVVVATRGHRHDVEVLSSVAPAKPRYVGMIGSRRRVLAVTRALRERGVPDEFIDAIYAPIGLDIGAESPEEIGLAIVAEILCVLRGRSGGSLRWRPAGGKGGADHRLA